MARAPFRSLYAQPFASLPARFVPTSLELEKEKISKVHKNAIIFITLSRF